MKKVIQSLCKALEVSESDCFFPWTVFGLSKEALLAQVPKVIAEKVEYHKVDLPELYGKGWSTYPGGDYFSPSLQHPVPTAELFIFQLSEASLQLQKTSLTPISVIWFANEDNPTYRVATKNTVKAISVSNQYC